MAGRSRGDAAITAQLLYSAPDQFGGVRRGTDFYPEGTLIWLDADVTIRRLTNNQKSLDDFCKLFHGGQNTAPMVKPYTREDVIATLGQVVPYDWAKFIQERVYDVNARAPLGGIEGGGWKLIYNDTPNDGMKTAESTYKFASFIFTLGFKTKMAWSTMFCRTAQPRKPAWRRASS